MKKHLLGLLFGLIISSIIYYISSFYYHDIIQYLFNTRNQQYVKPISEVEILVNFFKKDIEKYEMQDKFKIDSLASEHFSNQGFDFNILKYPKDHSKLEMIIYPKRSNYWCVFWIKDDSVRSFINVELPLR